MTPLNWGLTGMHLTIAKCSAAGYNGCRGSANDALHSLKALKGFMRMTRRLGLLMLVLLSAACAYRGGSDVFTTKFTWFSYLNGDDIRARCVPGGPSLYRFVYNGVYTRQVRTFAIAPNADGRGWILRARALTGPMIQEIIIDDPIQTAREDPIELFGSLAGTRATSPLSDRDIDALDTALATSGFFRPAPKGLRLRSEDYYWIGIVCLDGRVTFNAFLWPSRRFDALTFPALLLAWDPTEVPYAAPEERPFAGLDQDQASKGMNAFTLTVGDNGLAGHFTLF